ncbi:hypothetical protein [uncultured Ruegeria sp.]|uniref:hypothetical protein n=1 Tax=uncultured Ruegeria sp. TaxID=259304 RepID=UPI00262AA57A|nr:hypothetical protein [uncultured Ruegeria sp.]
MNKAILFVLFAVGAFFLILTFAVHYELIQAHDISIIGFAAFGSIIVLFAAAVLYQIGTGNIPLNGIISEPDDGAKREGKPKASLSRFQFLIFTFVVAGLFLMLSIEAGRLVDIPTNVLVLIGLSGTGFLAGKAISKTGDETAADNDKSSNSNTDKASETSKETDEK